MQLSACAEATPDRLLLNTHLRSWVMKQWLRCLLPVVTSETITTANTTVHVLIVQPLGCSSLQGAGLLLAESVIGARNALHSKAPRLLSMLLAEDVVKTSELKTDKVSCRNLLRARRLPIFAANPSSAELEPF